ncbi:MAG: hypothetical protein KAV87_15925 [Desulfobacteraceae bacterium]|nr:hypothetical protein [Desulfobacteraceae bacterium]
MKNSTKLIISLIVFFVLMLFVKPAYAYLDPGTGSMLLQALIAGVTIFIGVFWRRLRSSFSRFFRKKKKK